MKANTEENLCSTLEEGYQVCCSSGTRPDFVPKPNADGSCATYMTKKDDSCAKIAASRDLTITELKSFNFKTWG